MTIRPEEVERIAELARLEVPAERRERVARELSAVLDYIEVLRRLDLAGREPTAFAPAEAPPRADEPNGRRLDEGGAFAMAPEAEPPFFLVPPVVEFLEP